MTALKIACLDVLAPLVQAETRAAAGRDFIINFAASGDDLELRELVLDADFVLVGPAAMSADLIGHCRSVRLIQKYGVGMDKVNLDAARQAGIPVAIAAGSNAAPVSELALALMLAVSRRLLFGNQQTRVGEWPRAEMRATCFQLDGKTVGMFGIGAIAQATVRRLRGFDIRVIYHSRSRLDEATEKSLGLEAVTFQELLEQSDILSLHAPLNDSTRHVMNASALGRMKSSSILINTARGGLVDEAALVEALLNGRLRGAGLDVFDQEPPCAANPLFALENVVVMPHAGGGVLDNVRKVMEHAIGNMRRVVAGEPLSSRDVVLP